MSSENKISYVTTPQVLGGSSRTIGKSRPDSYTYDPDQWYLDQIEQYSSDPEFYEYLLKNPHLIRNSGSYQPYWYESYLLGTADTNEARYNAQLKSDASSWLANALAEKHAENYTSEGAQLSRQRSAGINPDLNGGSAISPGDPANPQSPDTDTNLPYSATNQGTADAYQTLHTTVSTIVSLVTTGMSMAQSFQGLQAGEISLLSSEISTEKDFASYIGSLVSQNLDADTIRRYIEGQLSEDDASTVAKDIISSLDSESNNLPPRIRRRLSHLRRLDGRFVNNAYTQRELQSILKSYYSDRYDMASTLGHPFYRDDFTSMMKTIGDYVNDYVIEYDKLWKDFDFDKLSFVDKESGLSLGQMEGQSALAAHKYQALRNKSDAMTENLWNNVISELKKKNTWWSNILLFLVPFVRSMAENARMPSVGLNASVRTGVHDVRDTYIHK